MKIAILGGAAALMLAACSGPSGPSDPSQYRGYDQRVSEAGSAQCSPLSAGEVAAAAARTSAVRAASGAGAVSPNAQLNRIATEQACHMAKTGLMSHAGPRNEGPKQRAQAVGYAPRIIAENIAAGPYDLSRVLAEWERSPSHRSNIAIGAMRDFGIGMAVGPDGNRYWAAVYAARK